MKATAFVLGGLFTLTLWMMGLMVLIGSAIHVAA